MEKNIEKYKLLIESYYKEVTLFYTKANNFMAIQLVIFTAIIAGFEKLALFPYIFRLVFLVLISICFIQLLVYKRGYDVLQIIVKIILKYEKENELDFLQDFNSMVASQKGYFKITKMNFPSYAVILINSIFLLSWIMLWIYFECNVTGIMVLLKK